MIEAITQAVDALEPAMVALLRKVVDMDSPSAEKVLVDQVADVLQGELEALGFVATRDAQARFGDNRICRHKPLHARTGQPRILIIGHCDTVYAEGVAAERPFRIEGEKAFGPGVNDMKGGIVGAIFALRALRDALHEIPVELTFIVNSDEEVGSPASRKVIVEEATAHDLVLVLEPGGDGQTLKTARRGVGIFHMGIEGVEAHAGSEPEKGANSIVEAAHKIITLEKLNAPAAGTNVTIGVIHGGTQPFVVPGHCQIEIDARVTSLVEQRRLEAAFDEISALTFVPRTSTRLSGSFHRPPMEASAQSMAYVRQFQRAAAAIGFPLGTLASGASSDANLTAAVGTPTIDGLGPHGGRPHSPEEFIELPSLTAKCKALALFLATVERETDDAAQARTKEVR